MRLVPPGNLGDQRSSDGRFKPNSRPIQADCNSRHLTAPATRDLRSEGENRRFSRRSSHLAHHCLLVSTTKLSDEIRTFGYQKTFVNQSV
jgi:hypothetical protein